MLFQANRGYLLYSLLSLLRQIKQLPCEGNSQCQQTVVLFLYMYCTRESGWVLRSVWRLRWLPTMSFISEAVRENEAWCWSEESGCVALKQCRIAVRVSHGWDVPIHSLLESCLSMQLPIRPTPGLPILICTT